MSTLHVMIGIQGSGKSTFSKKLSKHLGILVISTDEVRKKHPNIEESLVWPTVYDECAKELKEGRDVIFDATSITKKVRSRLFDNISSRCESFLMGAYYFDVPLDECIKRVEIRNLDKTELFLPIEVVSNYYDRIEKVSNDEHFCFVKIVDSNGEIK